MVLALSIAGAYSCIVMAPSIHTSDWLGSWRPLKSSQRARKKTRDWSLLPVLTHNKLSNSPIFEHYLYGRRPTVTGQNITHAKHICKAAAPSRSAICIIQAPVKAVYRFPSSPASACRLKHDLTATQLQELLSNNH